MAAHELPRATTNHLRHQVRLRFSGREANHRYPDHLVLFEVPVDGRNAAGRPSRQRINAVAVGLTTASRFLVHAMELKVSRSDLLRELASPWKADAAVSRADRFWLVLSDKSLLRPDDPVPPEWGVLAATGRGLRKVRDAADLGAGSFDRRFVSALVASGMRTPTYRRALGHQRGYQSGLLDGEYNGEHRGYAKGVQTVMSDPDRFGLRPRLGQVH